MEHDTEVTHRCHYSIERLDKTEYATLRWLADRGYDAGILDTAGVHEEHEDGGATLGDVVECDAWTITGAVDDDPDAFLACCGSRSLAEKLRAFLDAIV